MTTIEMRRLTSAGTNKFAEWLEAGAPGTRPEAWLSSSEFTEPLVSGWQVDPSKSFADRFELAKYIWDEIGSGWAAHLENDSGFWSWIALLYFEQFRPKKDLNRQEHYIYDSHRYKFYRHCVAMPVKLIRDFGDDARIFLSADITTMGDMLEQCMSRQYLMRSNTFRSVVRSLYFNEIEAKLKAGASSKVLKKKNVKGGWSQGGAGSVRRLALEVLRLNLAFNLEAMSASEMLGLLGKEYAKFKPSPGVGA
jgi:hypothetical protein